MRPIKKEFRIERQVLSLKKDPHFCNEKSKRRVGLCPTSIHFKSGNGTDITKPHDWQSWSHLPFLKKNAHSYLKDLTGLASAAHTT